MDDNVLSLQIEGQFRPVTKLHASNPKRTNPSRLCRLISPDRDHTLNNSSLTAIGKNIAWLDNYEKHNGRMRRTASLDALHNLSCTKNLEPRVTILVNKSTQTPEEWDLVGLASLSPENPISALEEYQIKNGSNNPKSDPNSSNNTPKKPYCSLPTSPWSSAGAPPSISESMGKFIRQKLHKNNKEGSTTFGCRQSPVPGDHNVLIKPYAFACINSSFSDGISHRSTSVPQISRSMLPRFRSSVEELNQEIENLVLKPDLFNSLQVNEEDHFDGDGRKAPIADYFRHRRSVNTQTPAQHSNAFGYDSNRSTPHSLSPTLSPPLISAASDPDISTVSFITSQKLISPVNNEFITKKPPDGCERALILHSDIQVCPRSTSWESPLKPAKSNFTLLPSYGSAFCAPSRSDKFSGSSELKATLAPNNES